MYLCIYEGNPCLAIYHGIHYISLQIYVIYISLSEVLIVLSACFVEWLFEIGAGVCDIILDA